MMQSRLKDLLTFTVVTAFGYGMVYGISYLSKKILQMNAAQTNFDYPKEYSINLMWVNKEMNSNQVYIFPSGDENNSGKPFWDKIISWGQKNPECIVNLWFDSCLVTKESFENTEKELNREIEKAGEKKPKIQIHDIRQLKRVEKNFEIFSIDIPVYFRSDLLRAIIAEEILTRNKNLYFVYADFDVTPMNKSELFDKETLKHLHVDHFIMAKEDNKVGFENSFQIFTYNEILFRALKLMIIKANILRARTFIEDIREKSNPNSIFCNPKVWQVHEVGFQENVFYSYPLMYTYFKQLQNLCELILPMSDRPYDKTLDGKEVLNTNAKQLMSQSSALRQLSFFPLPTKKVVMPSTMSAVNSIKSLL